MNTPHVGDVVHYVSYGTPGGEYASQCRAAIVAEVYPGQGPAFLSGGEVSEGEPAVCALVVLNPTGLFFNDCEQDENDKLGGTWHWPEHLRQTERTETDQ